MNRELIVDNFAGGGGASTGIEMATGRSVDIAINHDENAIAMHETNHPETLHYCESVFDIDPVAATAGQPVGLAWFSPDCRHFSKAKGSAPVKKEIRGLAWIVIRWILKARPRVIPLENVEEFKTWGPLVTDDSGNDYPCPDRVGETFAGFVAMLTTGIAADHPALAECCDILGIEEGGNDHRQLIAGLGYVVDYRELRACDYGAPTIRKRFFMLMRCDGRPIVWPEPTHGDPKSLEVQSGKLKPWRTAAECIDWSIPCPSIFERKRPLAENTLRRIARGIQRFVIDSPNPFIVKCNHTSTKTTYNCFRGQSLEEPLQTITKTHGYALVTPMIAGAGGSEYQAKPRSADQPMHTILKQSRAALVTPIIARIGQTGFGGDRLAYEAGKPLTTVTTKAEHLLVAPIIARQFGNSVGHRADEPNGTITAGGGGKSQLVATFLAKHFGGNYTGPGADLAEPAHTVTTVDHHALVTSNLIKFRGTCKDGQPVTEPMPTITAGGLHIGEVRAFLLKYYGNEKEGVSLTDPLHTVTTNDRFGLVTVQGIDYQIVDIGMRMLQPHELYAAQGFPSWYIIDQDYRGKRYAKDKQVARCGNAVPPPFAEALVRANLPELCVERKEVAA
ncbi:MAG: DNA cytosine methyltransferase [Serratia liquefaciens]|jgi:DNA (cytosine-5)-methyltransferase 1|nr:DNA cytosine methyltransferase [Serratia liquefaciens]MCH4233423.1 DNA cytosine methyltransferase [Serratia liquefaciens]MCH4261614.1 DNA cytosine methyltransferase [Serratia liquefaciens]MCI1214147.1 DNA cytosine methyltransferase [Serratia liquefaciens]MCI1235500.1 DNA cytosine methyltransferase [Serratia liquefaciens]